MSATPRPTSSLALLTIGQAPRADIVPDLLRWLPEDVDVQEFGALDGLNDEEIAQLAPGPADRHLVTRLGDGRQTVVRKDRIAERVQQVLDGFDPASYAAVALLCTGEFAGLRYTGLLLDAQHLVDHGVDAICAGAHRIGVILPLPEQIEEFHYRPGGGQELRYGVASPYEGDELESAARALAECDVVVMHCMGYTEEQRAAVVSVTEKPVLLARRLLGAGIAQVL